MSTEHDHPPDKKALILYEEGGLLTENTSLPNPHDVFFKSMMSDLRMAKKFFEIHLPQAYQAYCDFSTLQLESSSFVEANLRQQFSDVLYSMQVKDQPGYVYCLIEHVTQAKPLTAFQVLRYLIAVMHRHIQQEHKKPPVVIPLIFYRGQITPYPGSLDPFDCFDDPELARKVTLGPYTCIDVPSIPDETLATHEHIALLELLQKHITQRDLINLVCYLVDPRLRKYLSSEQFKNVVNYLHQAGHSIDFEAFIRKFNQHSTVTSDKNIMQTFAEHLEQKGRQQGMQQGKEEGKRAERLNIAKTLLSRGLDPAFVKEVAGLSDQEFDELREIVY